ncbi:MAG: urea carboxylase-associated family protein [Gemmatimonadetes bacterium]|nr:urea carboxylase-associated family protein [Gemmatimonadota bacterium]
MTGPARAGMIAPQYGVAFTLRAGERLRVTVPEGEQVADLVCFRQDDLREWLSSGRTLDYAETILLTTGHLLYSNRSRPMMEIVEDTVGRHDFLLTPCSPETFQILYENAPSDHPSCFGNLCTHLAPYGLAPDDIPTTFNLFMNVEIAADGRLSVKPPLSRAGDHVVLEARMDLVVGLTACSAEQSNNYRFKPIAYEVLG